MRLAGDLESLSAAFWVVLCLGAGVRLVTAVDIGEGDYVDYQHLTTAPFSLTLEQVQEAFEVARAEYDRSAPYPSKDNPWLLLTAYATNHMDNLAGV
ncbi:unnamed protein product [Ixodes pacificus]